MILPSPAPGFSWRRTAAGPALICDALAPHAGHFFTTRQWRLGSRSGADDEAWAEVAAAIETPAVARLRQVHGADAVRVHRAPTAPPDADIVTCDDPTLAIAVQAADCVPLLLVDVQRGAIAAAHAGWRGMVARVPRAALRAMRAEFGTTPADVIVAAGPSIGACCYEVGQDVRDGFARAGFAAEAIDRWFFTRPQPTDRNPSMPLGAARPEHWFFDGWACVREQLEGEGVPAKQIFAAHVCTASHPDALPSYRRDGTHAGRIAGVITARRP